MQVVRRYTFKGIAKISPVILTHVCHWCWLIPGRGKRYPVMILMIILVGILSPISTLH